MMQCDCHERYGIEVDSYDMFEELKNFFQKQIEKGVFREIPVEVLEPAENSHYELS